MSLYVRTLIFMCRYIHTRMCLDTQMLAIGLRRMAYFNPVTLSLDILSMCLFLVEAEATAAPGAHPHSCQYYLLLVALLLLRLHVLRVHILVYHTYLYKSHRKILKNTYKLLCMYICMYVWRIFTKQNKKKNKNKKI